MTEAPLTRDFELKLELLDACNARCSFCHQGGRRGRTGALMTPETALRWLRWAVDNRIPCVRFSGGEPTLHPHLLDLAEAACAAGLDVIVNTNGLVTTGMLEAMAHTVQTLKISMPAAGVARCDELVGVDGSLARKVETARTALELGYDVELLTALVPENIDHLEGFIELCADLPGSCWVPLRLEPSPDVRRPISRSELQCLAEQVDKLRERHPSLVPGIRLAAPFCAVDPIQLGARVFSGRAEDCGPFRSLTVDPHGQLVSCYSCRVPIEQTADFEAVLRDPEVMRLLSTAKLPARCRSCIYVARCMGGCACDFALVAHEGGLVDYLAVNDER
mgnify:CR=1 FL=1